MKRESSDYNKSARRLLKKNVMYKKEMGRLLSSQESDRIWEDAAEHLNEILDRYGALSGGVRFHTDNYIFPAAAVYLAAKDRVGQEQAYRIIEDASVRESEQTGRTIAGTMGLPWMRDIFIRVWDPLTKKMFGEDSGFQNVFYPKEKDMYRMDIVACPYNRYFTELGCPELTKIFCENDDRTYGKLPGLAFERTGTLGKGADKCDFCVRKL